MPQTADPELLRRIPLSARTVLMIDCPDGALAMAYRRMNPRARLLALVSDPATIPALEADFDAVAVDGGPHALPLDDADGRIDCIVYDRALERSAEPFVRLRRHMSALATDGMMLIKVPNAEYWRLTRRLLRGADADEADLMVPAVPPVFSLDGLRQGLLDIGLALCDVTLEEPAKHEAEAFVTAMTPALAALGVDPDDYARRACASHHVWRVRKTDGERLIVSGSMLEPVGGVSHVRVVHPLAAIGSDPLATVRVTEHMTAQPPPDDTPRIFVLHRPALAAQRGHALIRALRTSGYLVITEFDDHPDYFNMMRMGGDLTFRGVHALQTSTPTLATVLRRYNPEIAIFPNAVATLPPIHNFHDPDSMTLFFGALNREQCWQPLMDVINTVARMFGRRLRFQVVHDRHFFEALDTPHKAFTPTCDYETYLHLLGTSEICFMPLADTPFNRAKSDLKFIECGACRATALASTVVYSDSIQHGRTGLLFRDPSELYQNLRRLLDDPNAARAMGDAARHYVETERMLAYQVEPRIAWYRSLWQRRAELDAALDARLAADVANAA
ncbi:glycosyltransferase family protein [Rhodopila sp.]|jgi:hypothetical protein|uniref:glycosyltransferase family protein n=1 Tax=Rhodopila sp. TaxID=2480087 RepID=UPI002C05C89B|nr:glycosyltransferase [Rhodopila sp.]HVZ06371.1 glycosyltransferase [Rhodopila sp.]